MTLPNDYSRCHGTEAYVCQSCERRRQIERDSPDVWYPYMSPAETGGRCNYKIEGSMSTHYVCGCTSEDCRVNGCLMKRQRNESARFYSTDSVDCGCSTRSRGSMNIKVLTDEQKAQFVTDIAEYGTGFVALYSVVEAIEQAVLQSPEVQAWKRDAELYRGLRQMHWSKSHLCVVRNPKTAVKLGSDCPSGERLDVAIRAAMEKQT